MTMKILIAGFLMTVFCVAVAVLVAVLLVGVLIRVTGIDDNDE